MPDPRIRDGIVFVESEIHKVGCLRHAGFHFGGCGIPDNPPRVLNLFALVFILQGQATYHTSQGRSLPLKENDVLFIEPGVAHRYVPRSRSPWDEFWISFQGPLFEVWRTTGVLSAHSPIISLEGKEYWLNRFLSILPDPGSRKTLQPLERACRLNELLGEIFAYHESASLMPEDRQWLKTATNLLSEQHSPQAVSDYLGCSYTSFRRRFVRMMEEPPGRYRLRQAILSSAKLMIRDNLTNRELAARFNFSSEFHFSRAFRKVMGLPPMAYRRCAVKRPK